MLSNEDSVNLGNALFGKCALCILLIGSFISV